MAEREQTVEAPRDKCTAKYDQAIRKYRGDTEKLVNTLSFATDAINDCLSGTSCDADVPVHSIPWYAVVLRKSAGRKSTSHLKAGHYIPVDDEDVLRQLINFGFSRATLTSTWYATNTQKSEDTHRGYSKSNPKMLPVPGISSRRSFLQSTT